MPSYDKEIARIEAMVEDIRTIRNQTCELKHRSNPRYHALSIAVARLVKAADDMQGEIGSATGVGAVLEWAATRHSGRDGEVVDVVDERGSGAAK